MPTQFNNITDADVQLFTAGLVEGTFLNSLDHYQRIATKVAIYPGHSTPLGLMYVALKMNGEAGEFAEHVGKAFRDDGLIDVNVREFDDRMFIDLHDLTLARKDALIKEVGDVLWYLSAACNELGITLSQAATANLAKLNDRAKRGKLSGSGDNR